VVVIGQRPAGELHPNARILQVVRAVDAQLGNAAQVQRASTDANIRYLRLEEALPSAALPAARPLCSNGLTATGASLASSAFC
jgi:hypothetical protein